MADGQHGMTPQHTWAGKPHNRLDAFAHLGSIAMYGALVADRLFNPKRALFNPFLRIYQKSGTIPAKILSLTVAGAAVHADHGGNGTDFEVHALRFIGRPSPCQG